jgi:hypothetical protein
MPETESLNSAVEMKVRRCYERRIQRHFWSEQTERLIYDVFDDLCTLTKAVFSDVATCGLVEDYLTLFPKFQDSFIARLTDFHISDRFLARCLVVVLMMEVANTSETSVMFHQTTWCNNPE